MKKNIFVAGFVLFILAAVFLLIRTRNNNDDGVLVLSGNVEVTEVNMGFVIPGRVTELGFEEGQTVRPGDRLALLDQGRLNSEVTRKRALLSEVEARLKELQAGARPQELEQARANVKAAAAELTKARKDFGRAEVLFRNGAIPAQQMDQARKIFDASSSQHRAAAEALSLVREGPRREEVEAAEHRVAQAEAALKVAEEQFEDTIMVSPLGGVILSRNIEPGETVAPGTPVYTIGDLQEPWIKVYVKEQKLGLVKLGQKAEVTTDSYPDKVYEGVVTTISSEAEFTPKNVQTQEERVKLVFGVKIRVTNSQDELKPGMPADVRIRLD